MRLGGPLKNSAALSRKNCRKAPCPGKRVLDPEDLDALKRLGRDVSAANSRTLHRFPAVRPDGRRTSLHRQVNRALEARADSGGLVGERVGGRCRVSPGPVRPRAAAVIAARTVLATSSATSVGFGVVENGSPSSRRRRSGRDVSADRTDDRKPGSGDACVVSTVRWTKIDRIHRGPRCEAAPCSSQRANGSIRSARHGVAWNRLANGRQRSEDRPRRRRRAPERGAQLVGDRRSSRCLQGGE